MPPEQSLTSGATPYNVFHIIFGVLGLTLVLSRNSSAISSFNMGFGLIDLYQAAESFLNLPPKSYFLWTRVDDILHILIGVALVIIGGYGVLKRRRNG